MRLHIKETLNRDIMINTLGTPSSSSAAMSINQSYPSQYTSYAIMLIASIYSMLSLIVFIHGSTDSVRAGTV